MKTEEVKYVYQQEGPLLVPKTKNGAVYQETTVSNNRSLTTGNANKNKSGCWPGHLFSRLRLILSCLAIVTCLVVIAVSDLRRQRPIVVLFQFSTSLSAPSPQFPAFCHMTLYRFPLIIQVLMTNGIKASNNREQAQEEEIAMLKELVENQQSRLHRMQKELQFLVTRQKVHFINRIDDTNLDCKMDSSLSILCTA